MMGRRQVEHAALFCEFSLERRIPTDNLLRSIDRFVELVSWKFQRVELRPDWTVERFTASKTALTDVSSIVAPPAIIVPAMPVEVIVNPA
jgi:hypothetical protein